MEIGKLIQGNPARDAIHFAVAPVIAGDDLKPGEHVGMIKPGVCGFTHDLIGIVDPFLKHGVKKGEKFWLMLYPGTITSLTHHWEHPSFDNQSNTVAEQWLREFAAKVGISYQELMDAAEGYLKHGEYLNHGEKFEGVSIPDVFWDHYEEIEGILVPEDDRGSFFTCSC